MIQNLIFIILFFEKIISGKQIFDTSPQVLMDIIRAFFIPDFLAENLKANQN